MSKFLEQATQLFVPVRRPSITWLEQLLWSRGPNMFALNDVCPMQVKIEV